MPTLIETLLVADCFLLACVRPSLSFLRSRVEPLRLFDFLGVVIVTCLKIGPVRSVYFQFWIIIFLVTGAASVVFCLGVSAVSQVLFL